MLRGLNNAENWQSFVSQNNSNSLIDFCFLGDLDYDENLTVLDVLLILEIIINTDYNAYADMNYNQSINIQDILILIHQILNN